MTDAVFTRNALDPSQAPDKYADEVAGLQKLYDEQSDPAVAGREALARLMMTIAMPLSARGVTAAPRGPWTPSAQAPRVQREWKQPGDDSVGQRAWEILWGNYPRKPGQAVADMDTSVAGALKSPLTWLGTALGAAGIYSNFGLGNEPWPWENPPMGKYPGSHYEEVTARNAGRNADFDARMADRKLAVARGVRPLPEVSVYGEQPAYPEETLNKLAPYRLPGGVGSAPY